MRAKLFLTILLTYITMIFADSTAVEVSSIISGTIKDYHSNIPLSNVELVVTRIGDSTSANDTILSDADGSYSFNYLFEVNNYRKKYNQIRIEPLDNSTHWFHAERYDYTCKSQTSSDLKGISNSFTDSSKITGRAFYGTSAEGFRINEYKIIFTQTSEDSTEIKIDTINVDINDTYEFYTNIKKYKHFKMDLSSNKWKDTENPYYYWDYLGHYPSYSHNINPIDTDPIKLSGKITIIGKQDFPPIQLIANNDFHPIGPNGEFTHYVPRGWSGAITLWNTNYSWVSEEPTFTNLQEDQVLNLTIKKESHIVSGYVSIENGDSVKNVLIDFGNSYTMTDSLGYYSIEISHGDSFEITPYKEGYTFSPSSLSDLICTSDITLNITSIVTKEITITGTINTDNRNDIDSVLVLFSGTGNGSCWTDANGNFSHSLRYDWSGTITPTKQEKVFNPPLILVENLDNDTVISSIKVQDTTHILMNNKPTKFNKMDQPEFEIIIYNLSGRLVGRVGNIELAKALTKKASGLYIYQRIIKNSPKKIRNNILIK